MGHPRKRVRPFQRRADRASAEAQDIMREGLFRGWSVSEIARRAGVHRDTVHRFAAKNNMSLPRRSISKPRVLNYGWCKTCRCRVVMPCLACKVRAMPPQGYRESIDEPTLALKKEDQERLEALRREKKLNWIGESAQ